MCNRQIERKVLEEAFVRFPVPTLIATPILSSRTPPRWGVARRDQLCKVSDPSAHMVETQKLVRFHASTGIDFKVPGSFNIKKTIPLQDGITCLKLTF
jgi:hypothetical protein